jgi:pimeloyl-ACP methyl ester carboxylesterase
MVDDGGATGMSYVCVSDGTRLRLAQRGVGKTIVLVHGWKMSHRAWDKAFVRLAEKFRVVAYDLRGMGESDKPDSACDFSEHADDLEFIVNALDLQDVTVVGWSMGCSVTLSWLARRPLRAARAVLMNGPVKLLADPGFPYGITATYLAGLLNDLVATWPERERAFVSQIFRTPHPETVDWFTRIALQTPLDVVIRTVVHQSKLDLRDVVAAVDIPLLAMFGRHDPYYSPALGEWIAQTAKRGRHVIFEDSAHCPPLEETEKFVAALSDFITSV